MKSQNLLFGLDFDPDIPVNPPETSSLTFSDRHHCSNIILGVQFNYWKHGVGERP